VKGKVDEAKKILRNAAKVNKQVFSEDDVALLEKTTSNEETDKQRLGNVKDLFASRGLALRALISWYCW